MLARPALVVLVLAALLAASPVTRAAQDVTPAAGDDRLDLAAMALDSSALPEGYRPAGEGYQTGEAFGRLVSAGGITPEEVEATGLRWFYESRYAASANGTDRIRSYVEEYEDEAGARAGFELLEDETRVEGAENLEDQPAPDVGEEPREKTIGTLTADQETGAVDLQTVDITFRVGSVIAGVAVETIGDTAPDQDLAEDLAGQLAQRVEGVLDGDYPEGVDPETRTSLLPLDPTLRLEEGYLTVQEVLAASPAEDVLADYVSGYARAVALNPDMADEPWPLVTAALSTFNAADSALAVLDQADDLQPVFPQLERVDQLRVPGADAVVAYRFDSPLSGGDEVDSFRVLLVVEGQLATVDVQAATSSEVAEEAALDLATQQAACLATDEPCDQVSIPESLQTSDATPVASAEGSWG
ncbi:MAG: hypothetical protein M3Q71_05415 [Chloroflexota bacterium]|nr:hypothetical protein [Chloroflexota bacterium]